MAADWTQNTKALKILVGVMTTLLVVGLIVLVIGMARTAGDMSAQVGTRDVALPAGATVLETTAADGRLYLTLQHGDGRQSILVLNAQDGRPLGELRLVPGP